MGKQLWSVETTSSLIGLGNVEGKSRQLSCSTTPTRAHPTTGGPTAPRSKWKSDGWLISGRVFTLTGGLRNQLATTPSANIVRKSSKFKSSKMTLLLLYLEHWDRRCDKVYPPVHLNRILDARTAYQLRYQSMYLTSCSSLVILFKYFELQTWPPNRWDWWGWWNHKCVI